MKIEKKKRPSQKYVIHNSTTWTNDNFISKKWKFILCVHIKPQAWAHVCEINKLLKTRDGLFLRLFREFSPGTCFFHFAICRLSLALGRAAGAKGLTEVDGRKLNIGENCIFEHSLDKTPLFYFSKGTFLSTGWDFGWPLMCSLPDGRAGLDAGVGGRVGGGGGGQRKMTLERVG